MVGLTCFDLINGPSGVLTDQIILIHQRRLERMDILASPPVAEGDGDVTQIASSFGTLNGTIPKLATELLLREAKLISEDWQGDSFAR